LIIEVSFIVKMLKGNVNQYII